LFSPVFVVINKRILARFALEEGFEIQVSSIDASWIFLLSTKYNSAMSKAIETLQAAQKKAMSIRPKVGGFPYLAEVLRQAGVKQNVWSLPSCQSIYFMEDGPVVQHGTPLVEGLADIPQFNEGALIKTLRTDQAGESIFPEVLKSTWEAGVIWYQADFEKRTVTYGGVDGETYVESYPEVKV
jgi:uncharacterized protein YbcV (DUF1398 family)